LEIELLPYQNGLTKMELWEKYGTHYLLFSIALKIKLSKRLAFRFTPRSDLQNFHREVQLRNTEPISFQLAARRGYVFSPNPDRYQHSKPCYVAFNRAELNQILSIYGRQVAAGEWRDYAIDALSDRAVFSIFRRSSESPLYRIEKSPELARKQGAYMVIASTGLILKRSHDLISVLKVIDRERKLTAVG